jgi:disulfide bond formation protein DsbB
MAYYWGLPILAAILILWNRIPLTVWYVVMAVAAAIFAWGAYMGVYHAGVEWGFWPGPTACTGAGTTTEMSFDQLSDINNAPKVVPCDVVQFRFLGISLAGYNALVSLAVVALLLIAIVWQWRFNKTKAAV